MSHDLIVIDPGPRATPWPAFCIEALEHLRLGHTVVTEPDCDLGDARIILVPAAPGVGVEWVPSVTACVESGATLVLFAGAGAFGELAGVSDGAPFAQGWVTLEPTWAWAPRFGVELHAFGGRALQVNGDATVLAQWIDGKNAISSRRLGAGEIIVVGPDVWQSVGRIQQGRPVTDDSAIAAPDGSAEVGADGIHRADDGLALSYDRDRALPNGMKDAGTHPTVYPPAAPSPMFHRPQADLWRELVWQLVFDAAAERSIPLGWLNYWPAGVAAIGHMSQDSDQNQDAHARVALDVFAEADVQVTWCHCWPGGYSAEVIQAIADAGHEQALHYNALHPWGDGQEWGPDGFQQQYDWACGITGTRIVSNKNHYTRWEGWTEFYEWCERAGIQIDETRGPSKPGTIGFPYGTSHVGFPVSPDGERYDVLALPLHSQDLAWATHEAGGAVILDQALQNNGVAHILFHGANFGKSPRVAPAVGALVAAARRRGMPWWTAGRINEFERARRRVGVGVHATGSGRWTVRLAADAPLEHAGVLVAVGGAAGMTRSWAAVDLRSNDPVAATTVIRHGRAFVELTVDLPVGITEIALVAVDRESVHGAPAESTAVGQEVLAS